MIFQGQFSSMQTVLISSTCILLLKLLNDTYFVFFHRRIFRNIPISFVSILTLFAFFFTEKFSISFASIFTLFVFFFFRKIIIQITCILMFFVFCFFIKFVFFKKTSVSFSSILTFFCFVLQKDLIVFAWFCLQHFFVF